nr:heparan-alpha-glucosaminide N-acetyltransferase domain-containing protein [Methylobacterium sp. SyP6R]
MTAPDTPTARIGSIDALRGFVMLLMLVDHVRDIFYVHAQVRDPMDLSVTAPDLVVTRLISHLCAPVFLLLTGLSASLYARRHGTGATARFLLTRGLFLVGLEVTLVNLAWTGRMLPPVLYLQVIWAIGLGMIALAGLLRLPRPALAVAALLIVLGHNLLDGIVLAPGQAGYVPWSILHQRGLLDLPWGVARTSYPVLPWIGVAAAGYVLGPWFATDPRARRRRLLALGAAALAGFLVLRGLNGYGDPVPWQAGPTLGMTILSFLNLTKYPPSADFLLLTLGLGLWLLAVFEALPASRLGWLRVFGGAPLFFYLVHLWLLRGLYDLAFAAGLTGPSGKVELGSPAQLWLVALVLGLPLYGACRWMVGLKRRGRHPVLRYL